VNSSVKLFVASFLISSVFTGTAAVAETERGLASYYADNLHGNKTASGESYDKNAMTAAHRTLEFGTLVVVTYVKTGKSVAVRVNDRGPHAKDRIIDLSGAAARKVGLRDDGVGEVTIQISN
jgi:rare lipoprotein A